MSIVEVVKRFMPLKKVGASFKGRCPVCSRSTFYVHRARGFWHCFECNRTGDAAEFVSLMAGGDVN